MATSPAFQFYASDWAHSVSSMTLEERGAYITLLAWSWEHGPVPNDLKRLAAILGTHLNHARRVLVEVLKRWHLNGEGQWINPRLEKVRAATERFIEKQTANGRLGGRPKKNPTETQDGTQTESQTKPTGNPTSNPNKTSPISDLRSPDQKQKEQCAGAHSTLAVLTKIAHSVLDDIQAGHLNPEDAKEETKARAAKAQIAYDARAITKALDSAEAQQRRRRSA